MNNNYFDYLPTELLSEIFIYLSYEDVLKLEKFYSVGDSNIYWSKKLYFDYPYFNMNYHISYNSLAIEYVKPTKKFQVACNKFVEEHKDKEYKDLIDKGYNYKFLYELKRNIYRKVDLCDNRCTKCFSGNITSRVQMARARDEEDIMLYECDKCSNVWRS